MTIVAATLRADFPEFGDTTAFPDALLTFWLGIGENLLNAERWDTLYTQGVELFAAHNIVIEKQNIKTATIGGAVGAASGPVASKAVDKVNVSYDTGAAAMLNAGHWNLTNYGTRYLYLARLIGAGGIQL